MSSARGVTVRRQAPGTCSNEVSKPPTSTKMDTGQTLFSTVVRELDDGLVVTNDSFALMDGSSSGVDPEDLDASKAAVKHRAAEHARRGAIRRSLERMTLFFKRPRPRYLWSRPQVLFYGKPTALISRPMITYQNHHSHHIPRVWRKGIRRWG